MKFILNICSIGFMCACVAFSSIMPVQAQTTPDTAAIEAAVRDVLLNKPEILAEALDKMQAYQASKKTAGTRAILQTRRDEIFGDAGTHAIVGNPDGKIALVAFYDYNCGYCRKSLGDLKAILSQNTDVKLILKELPILSKESNEAALVSLQLHKHPKFWAFHEKLFNSGNGERINGDTAVRVAKELSMGDESLKSKASDPALTESIKKTYNLASALGIRGTPAFVIGDEVVYGAVGVEPLNAAIANMRKCGKAVGCQ